MNDDIEMTTCSTCEGTGVVECERCGQDTDCDECEGTGEVEA